jgi:hypothetical protein
MFVESQSEPAPLLICDPTQSVIRKPAKTRPEYTVIVEFMLQTILQNIQSSTGETPQVTSQVKKLLELLTAPMSHRGILDAHGLSPTPSGPVGCAVYSISVR